MANSDLKYYPSKLKELLEITIREQASDLHISVEHPPILRISGRLVSLVKMDFSVLFLRRRSLSDLIKMLHLSCRCASSA